MKATDKPANKGNLLLFWSLILLFLAKNTGFIINNYLHPYNWGLNHTTHWLWQIVFQDGIEAFGLICICGASIFALRRRYKQALYFIAVPLLLFPFHTLHYPFRTGSFPGLQDQQNIPGYIATHLSLFVWLFFLLLFLTGMLISQLQERPAKPLYQSLLVMIIAYILFDLVKTTISPNAAFSDITPSAGLRLKAFFLCGMTAWLLTMLNYFRYTGIKWLRHLLFCISVVAGFAACYGIYRLLVPPVSASVQLTMVLAAFSSLVLIFLYFKFPHYMITAIAPALPVFCGSLILFIYFDQHIRMHSAFPVNNISDLQLADTWWATLVCLAPALAAPFFRPVREKALSA